MCREGSGVRGQGSGRYKKSMGLTEGENKSVQLFLREFKRFLLTYDKLNTKSFGLRTKSKLKKS